MDFRLNKIIQSIREFAKEQNIEEEKALVVGNPEMAKESVKSGREIDHGNLPDGAKDHH